jgi:hypothetical protein
VRWIEEWEQRNARAMSAADSLSISPIRGEEVGCDEVFDRIVGKSMI